ncbi:MAG: helix-turn-helix domain-containing protein [Lachnospiraceae bacterium]|nr:helix-turn-helix domain-containing protein [Lachnospiraceae bacterium]
MTKELQAFIADRRKSLGLTQAEVAQKLNVSFQAVSKWENGTLPATELLAQLAAMLGVSVDELLAVPDTIVCGSAEKETIKSLIKGISQACRENECVLVGGETSLQPQVVGKGCLPEKYPALSCYLISIADYTLNR